MDETMDCFNCHGIMTEIKPNVYKCPKCGLDYDVAAHMQWQVDYLMFRFAVSAAFAEHDDDPAGQPATPPDSGDGGE